MNQNDQKNKTNGFEKETDFFYIPIGAIFVELKDSSDKDQNNEGISGGGQ